MGKYPFPMKDNTVPGSDGAGTVESVGKRVTRFKPGGSYPYTDPRQPRENLNSLEPTLTLGHLLCKVLGQCSLQNCSVFPLYEVDQRIQPSNITQTR